MSMSTFKDISQNIKKLKSSYEAWFLNNAESCRTTESLLKSATYLLSGSDTNSELKLEGVYTLINLIQLYHDHIYLNNALNLKIPRSPYFPSENVNTATWLSFIEKTELLSELLAQLLENPRSIHFAIRNLRATVIFLAETIKASLRFQMLIKNDGSILVHKTIPSRESIVPEPKEDKSSKNFETEDGRQNRKSLLQVQKEIRLKMRETVKDVEPTRSTPGILIGEILWIFRPLIYLICLFYWGKLSWKPWFISLFIDLASRGCSIRKALNDLERSELLRRTFIWVFYLLRSPMLELILKNLGSVGFLDNSKFKHLEEFLHSRQHYYYITKS